MLDEPTTAATSSAVPMAALTTARITTGIFARRPRLLAVLSAASGRATSASEREAAEAGASLESA